MEVFDRLAGTYQAEHGRNPHQAALVGRIAALLPDGAEVLDLGCGTGVPTAAAFTGAGHRVTGVDISAGMLEMARAQVPLATFVHADLTDLPGDLGPFDAVTAFFSLLMLGKAEIERTLDRVAGWLRPGGCFALAMVDFDGDAVPIDFLGATIPVSGYHEPDLAALLTAHGFTIADITTVGFTPPNGPPEQQIFALTRLAA